MAALTVCPAPERLRDLLDGNLSETDQTELTSHLDRCAACRQKLEALAAGGESLSDLARNLQTGPPSDDPPLQNVIEKIKESGSETVSQPGTNPSDDPVLGYLSPSTNPGHLGRLGDFEIVKIVGRGGMGVVFKAFDDTLHRVVAVKVMAPQLAANAAARKRFEREGRAAAAVSHDHIVAIHRVAEEKGLPYIVMQFVSGESLQDRLDRSGPLELKEILRIGLQTASGLAAAHAQGLIHRDIKPANILLENGISRVKITDFGLARAVDDASVTQSGVITGTPMFMAPEQASGEPVDHRSDLFSLGSVLYALCTGHPPFRATGTMAVLMRVIEDTPRPIREINPDIPDWLCALIAKLQAKKPADRFQSAKEVAELLEQHLAHVQQPNLVARPAVVLPIASEVPAAPNERAWIQLLDETDHTKRIAQHGFLIGGVFLIVAASAIMILGHSRVLTLLCGLPLAGGMLMVIAAGYVKQSWTVSYKGRILQYENPLFTAERLLLDGAVISQGKESGLMRVLHGTIPGGPGSGDRIRVLADGGALHFRCRIEASEGPANAGAHEPLPGKRRSQHRLTAAIFFIVLVALVGLGVMTLTGNISLFPRLFTNDKRSTSSLLLTVAEPQATIAIDDREVGKTGESTAPYTFEVAPGKHTVEVRKPGRPSFHEVITLQPGEWRNMTVGRLFAGDRTLEGRWNVLREETSGMVLPPGLRNAPSIWWQFKGAQVQQKFDPKDDPSECEYRVDASRTPAEIDLVSGAQILRRGIFELQGDELRLCFSTPPEARPRTFVTRMNTSLYITVLRRDASDSSQSKGFVPLFNRKDLSGWKTPEKQTGVWSVVDGVLIGSKGPGQLYSDRSDYANFHLRMEASISKGSDCNLCFRTAMTPPGLSGSSRNPSGYAVDLNEGRDVYTGPISFLNPQTKSWTTYGCTMTVKPDEWFTLDVIADGNHLATKVNGASAVDIVEPQGAFKSGHLALKMWRPDTVVKFRTIEIKELAPK